MLNIMLFYDIYVNKTIINEQVFKIWILIRL